jgi:hypothetical protein
MGKPVSAGQAFGLLSALALNTNWAEFEGDAMQQLLINRPKIAGIEFGAWLKGYLERANASVFPIIVGDGRTLLQVLDEAPYTSVAMSARNMLRRIEVQAEPAVRYLVQSTIDIELIRLEEPGNSPAVLDEFARRGLSAPTEEDAARFWERYGELVRKDSPIVFLHTPRSCSPQNPSEVLYIGEAPGGPQLDTTFLPPINWPSYCRFAARRLPKAQA